MTGYQQQSSLSHHGHKLAAHASAGEAATQAATKDGVLVLAPTGRDAQLICAMLQRFEFESHAAQGVAQLCEGVAQGIGALILAEEALGAAAVEQLIEALAAQPHWSDLPLILLTTAAAARSSETSKLVQKLARSGNVSLLERPLRALTLTSAVESALRARRRQYDAKSLYEDLERRVQERSAEILAKNLELEGFTYSISHDLRAPLRAIVARASIVLDEERGVISTEGVENLQRLAKAAKNMAALVDDLLRYARIGMQQVEAAPVDLAALATEIADDLLHERPLAQFEFCFEAGSGVQGDSRLLGMALRNLFDNACKYTAPKEEPRICFGSYRMEGEQVFYVSDSGIGFDMAYADKLFKPFERLHREEYPGTGIGLANVRRAIERHGGRIWAQGAPHQGATFFFTLPPHP